MFKIKKILWISLSICAILWSISQICLLYSNATHTQQQINQWFEPITAIYGIRIVYEIGDDFFSTLENPPVPAGPAKDSKTIPIRHRVLARYPEILQTAFRKYPVKMIRDHVKAIHFAGQIIHHGFKAAGSYDPFRKILFLVNDGCEDNDRAVYVVHHELSSLFLSSHSFFVNPWTANNPEGYVYLYDKSSDTLQTFNNTSSTGTALDFEKGFMNTYGQTNFENDFNEYSAMIFTYPVQFKKIMDQYPRVRSKFLVWLKYYHSIDPVFTEAYLFGKE